jgi:hypothetical protein
MIRRYIAREIVGAVLFVLAGFLGLFAFFDFINEIDDVGQAGYRLQHALAHVLLGLPSRVYELMPIAALIGSIYALAQFASHSSSPPCGRRPGAGGVRWPSSPGSPGSRSPPRSRANCWRRLRALAQSIRLSALASTVGAQFRPGCGSRTP